MNSLAVGDESYPPALNDLKRPPSPLYTIGDETLLSLAPNRLVAIVGTRNASPYGMRTATALAEAFVAAGIGVVSGLARGIDSAAHRATLAAGGKTIAVMGTGVDIPYPVGHRALHAEIAEKGLVVSENESGMHAYEGCFPRRNRIIAALARVTIVVEAPYKSGAINTATQALELGRIVAAVPGPIDSARSAGCNLLIRDGGQIIHSIDDALMLYGKTAEGGRRTAARAEMGSLEADVWEALGAGDATADQIAERAGLDIRKVLEGIARLELNGMVQQQLDGSIARIKIA